MPRTDASRQCPPTEPHNTVARKTPQRSCTLPTVPQPRRLDALRGRGRAPTRIVGTAAPTKAHPAPTHTGAQGALGTVHHRVCTSKTFKEKARQTLRTPRLSFQTKHQNLEQYRNNARRSRTTPKSIIFAFLYFLRSFPSAVLFFEVFAQLAQNRWRRAPQASIPRRRLSPARRGALRHSEVASAAFAKAPNTALCHNQKTM
jgi:hypothetical protein